MSIVRAARCECCGKVYAIDDCLGVSIVEDLFDKLSSYATVKNPEKAAIHICVSCFRDKVYGTAARLCDRRKNEDGYKLKVKELSYSLRFQAVYNYRNKKF